MARARNIKPALFKNEILGEADPLLTILFQGLWCLADRGGKLEDRPKRIKAEIFPYRELPDFNGYLTVLAQLGFIERYHTENTDIIKVLKFNDHQSPHKTEKASVLPDRPANTDFQEKHDEDPLDNGAVTVRESLIPDSLVLIPDSLKEIGASDKSEPVPPIKRERKVFKPPVAQEVFEYLAEKQNTSIDPNHFLDFYSARGWKLSGGTKMADWKAAVRTWISREQGNGTNRPNGNSEAHQRKLTPGERARAKQREAYERESAGQSSDPRTLVSIQ
jgi:hypothetical protein